MATTVALPKPHSKKQRQLIEYPGSIVCLAGRRWGKTEAGCLRLLRGVTSSPGLYWWVGLSWRSASMKRAWRILRHWTRQVWLGLGYDPAEYIRESTKELIFPNDAEIWLRTAERPDSLAGEGIRGVVLDEFTLMSEAIWSEYITATLLDHAGWACFLGVPKGEGWHANLWRATAGRAGWLQMHATSYDNPSLDRALIDEIKAHTPERIFRQEYLAEVVDDAGAVFRNVLECATATAQSGPVDGHSYVFGVDWARHSDYTVFTCYDVTDGAMVAMDRFTGLPYELQLSRLRAMRDRFRPSGIFCEVNAMGEPLFEQLSREGLPVRRFVTTAQSKAGLIDGLALAFERQEIRILPDPVLIGELQAYQLEQMESGTIRYGAPSGMHDDCVMSLALALQGVKRKGVLFSGLSDEARQARADVMSQQRDYSQRWRLGLDLRD